MKANRMAMRIAVPVILLITLILSVFCFSLSGSAATSGTHGSLNWSYDSGTKTLSFSGTGEMAPMNPESGFPWMGLEEATEKIVIGEGITSVADDAFEYFYTSENITVSLPSTLKKIGNNSFSGMQLKSIRLPGGLTAIGNSAFKGCFALKEINLPSSLTSIGEDAFRNCAIETLTVPGSVKKVPAVMIISSSVKTIILEEGITEIGEEAFSGNSSLESVQLPSTLTKIGDGAFLYSGIKSITIPASVTCVGKSSFADCPSLQTVTFLGNAPSVTTGNGAESSTLLVSTGEGPGGNFSIRYSKYASGWSSPTWKGVKAEAYDPCEKGHTYGSWSVTSAASCTKEGAETRTCSVCKNTETRTVAKTAHVFGAWSVTKAATASATGTETRKCNNCPETETRTIPKLTSSDKPTGNTSASTDVDTSTDTSSDSNTSVDVPVIDPPVLDTEVNTTKPENNALSGNIGGTADELIDALLTEDEKQAVADGDAVQVYLNVTDIAENLLDAQKASIEAESGNKTVVAWLDISLFKQVGEADSEKITEPGKAVVITLTVPEEYRTAGEGMNRIFSVIRDHNGTLETLPAAFDAATGLVSFSTDGFSTYALAYEDVAVENADTNTDSSVNSGTNLPTATDEVSADKGGFPWWIVIVCGVVVLAAGGVALWYFLIFKKKPAEPKE